MKLIAAFRFLNAFPVEKSCISTVPGVLNYEKVKEMSVIVPLLYDYSSQRGLPTVLVRFDKIIILAN